MGDGAVRFIKESIGSWPVDLSGFGVPFGSTRNQRGAWVDLPKNGIWQALATRAGGEVISSDDF